MQNQSGELLVCDSDEEVALGVLVPQPMEHASRQADAEFRTDSGWRHRTCDKGVTNECPSGRLLLGIGAQLRSRTLA